MGSKQQLFKVTRTRAFNFYTCKELTSSCGGKKTQNKVFQEKKERQTKRETECTCNCNLQYLTQISNLWRVCAGGNQPCSSAIFISILISHSVRERDFSTWMLGDLQENRNSKMKYETDQGEIAEWKLLLQMAIFNEDVLFIHLLLVKHRSLCLDGRNKMSLFTSILLNLTHLENL